MAKTIRKIDGLAMRKFLFYAGYALFMFSFMIKRVTFLEQTSNVTYILSLILLVTTGCMGMFRMPKKRVFIILTIGLLVFLAKTIAGVNAFLMLWLLVVASKGIKFDNIVKIDLLVKIPLLVIVSLFYFGGMTEVNLHFRDGIIRHSMGFSNPNIFSTLVMSVVAEIFYLRRNKLGVIDILFAIAMVFLVDYFADSRTQMLCIIAMLIILFVWKKFGNNKREMIKTKRRGFGSFLIDYSFSILLIISCLFASLYVNHNELPGFVEMANDVTSGRLNAASKMIEKYEVKPFGQEVEIISRRQVAKTGKETQTLDNVYVYMVLAIGIVPTIIYCYLMKAYMQYTDKNCKILRYIMLVYIVGGLMEHFIIEPQFNIFLLYFAYMLYGNPTEQIGQIMKTKIKGQLNG